jgi:hypothetical protein
MQLSIDSSQINPFFYTAEHYTRLILWRNIWTGTMPWDVEAITAYVEYSEGSVYCTNCTETGSQSKECRRQSVCGENMRGEEGASKKYRQLISWCWNKRINCCIFFMTPNKNVWQFICDTVIILDKPFVWPSQALNVIFIKNIYLRKLSYTNY